MTKSKLVKWRKNPLKSWKQKRDRDKKIQEIEAKQQAKEYKQKIEKEAYLLWEADGKPEGKDNYYWKLAKHKIRRKNILDLCNPYYLLEKWVLEPVDAWISRQAFFTILERLGNLTLIVAVIAFIFGENVRRNNEVFSAWQTITSANGQTGSGGRIEALEFLNSRPRRFPWIWRTEEGILRTKEDSYLHYYWDEKEKKRKKECKVKRLWGFRWKRQPLEGLSAPEAYLRDIHLCGADLIGANLQKADLITANLQKADLWEANLQEAVLIRANLQETNLWEANLQEANLRGANLQKADLWEANLQEADLGEVNLQEADLIGANLQEALLWAVNLQEADLIGANFQKADLIGANLQEADLGEVNLQEANLGGANLQEADLKGANLQEADLKGANLQEADLKGANLQKAYLGFAKKLTYQQIKSACNWEKGIYKGQWNWEKELVETIEPDNTNFIEELKKDKSSDPKEAPYCSIWDNKE